MLLFRNGRAFPMFHCVLAMPRIKGTDEQERLSYLFSYVHRLGPLGELLGSLLITAIFWLINVSTWRRLEKNVLNVVIVEVGVGNVHHRPQL